MIKSTILLQEYFARNPDTQVVVFLRYAEDVATVLALPGVRGVILRRKDQALLERFPGRIGWFDAPDLDWQLPEQSSPVMISLNGMEGLGVRATLCLLRGGVKRIIHYFDITYWDMTSVIFQTRTVRQFVNCLAARLWEVAFSPKRRGMLVTLLARWDEHKFRFLLRGCAAPLHQPDAFGGDDVILAGSTLGPGGAERQLVNTAVGLSVSTPWKVTVLCGDLLSATDSFHMQQLRDANIPVALVEQENWRSLDSSERRYFTGAIQDLLPRLDRDLTSLFLGFATEFCRRRPAVVHTWLDSVNVIAGSAAVLVGVPRVVLGGRSLSPTHFDFFQPYMRPLYRILLQCPQVAFLNNSEAGAADYARWLGVSRERITVVPNGIDFSDIRRASPDVTLGLRHQWGIPPEAPVVGAVMRFTEEKRPFLWLDIAEVVSRYRPDAHFLMIGDGPLHDEAREWGKNRGLERKLHMIGNQSGIAPMISAMTCLLLTSRVEGLPNVLIEAQMVGVPVVSSRVGGAPEAVDAGHSGWLVEGDDPTRYAERVLAVLADSEWRKKAEISGPAFIKATFGLDRMIQQTSDLYKSQ